MKKYIVCVVVLPLLGILKTLAQEYPDSIIYSLIDYDNKWFSDIFKHLGDTITFKFDKNYTKTYLFSTTECDTFWIKKKPKRNPKEGKHYILHKTYKGVQDENKRFYTPTCELENKQFSIVSVNLEKSNYSSYVNNIKFKLNEISNSDSVTFKISYEVASNDDYKRYVGFYLYPNKINHIIKSLIGKTYYIRTKGEYKKYTLKHGYFNCFIKSDYSSLDTCNIVSNYYSFKKEGIALNNRLYLEFASDEGVELKYDSDNRGHIEKIYTEIDYADYLYNNTPKQVNSIISDSLLNLKIEFPFSFDCIWGSLKNNAYISQEIRPRSRWRSDNCNAEFTNKELLDKYTSVLIADKINYRNETYYIATYEGKAFFIKTQDVEIEEEELSKMDSLSLCNNIQKEYFFQLALSKTKEIADWRALNVLTEILSYEKHGLAIVDWNVFDESEYTNGTGIKFNIFNPTSKTIKYITINFVGYNAVDDPVSNYGTYTLTRKGVGPIPQKESAEYEFEYVWHTDLVQYAKIKSIIVQYTDGTSKTITNAEQIEMPSYIKKYFYGEDLYKLSDFK